MSEGITVAEGLHIGFTYLELSTLHDSLVDVLEQLERFNGTAELYIDAKLWQSFWHAHGSLEGIEADLGNRLELVADGTAKVSDKP